MKSKIVPRQQFVERASLLAPLCLYCRRRHHCPPLHEFDSFNGSPRRLGSSTYHEAKRVRGHRRHWRRCRMWLDHDLSDLSHADAHSVISSPLHFFISKRSHSYSGIKSSIWHAVELQTLPLGLLLRLWLSLISTLFGVVRRAWHGNGGQDMGHG